MQKRLAAQRQHQPAAAADKLERFSGHRRKQSNKSLRRIELQQQQHAQ